jgi:hypothetical protein
VLSAVVERRTGPRAGGTGPGAPIVQAARKRRPPAPAGERSRQLASHAQHAFLAAAGAAGAVTAGSILYQSLAGAVGAVAAGLG